MPHRVADELVSRLVSAGVERNLWRGRRQLESGHRCNTSEEDRWLVGLSRVTPWDALQIGAKR